MHQSKHTAVQAGIMMAGMAQCLVVDSLSRKVVKTYPAQRNLILNQGMDEFATQKLCDLFLYSAAGTGTTPTKDDSGLTTAAQVTDTVTLVGGSFTFTDTATDAGKMIKWDSGAEARILTVTSPTVAVVANSATVVAGEFTVYRTAQVALATETKRNNMYLTGSGNCETTRAGSVISHKRTYDFSAEVGNVTYTELGFSRIATAGSNLFSRILLTSSVALVAGQMLRVVYTLSVTLSPTSPVVVGASPITGWAGATGTKQILSSNCSSKIASNGTTDTDNASGFEPSVASNIILTTVSTALESFASGTLASRNTNQESLASTLSSYTALSFTRDKTRTFLPSEGNRSDWRTILLDLGSSGDGGITGGTRQALVYLIDSNQEKLNTHTLTITFRLTWGRTLA